MEAQRTSYTYMPLDESRNEIRLLRLSPKPNRSVSSGSGRDDANDDGIHCSFAVVSLDESPEYEGLSYAWGDPKEVVPISLEGHEIHITTSLHCALDNLRLSESQGTRVIWADALCINQGDEAERESQIARMHHIYSKAVRVIAFLGEAWEGSDAVMTYLAMIGKDRDLHINREGELCASYEGLDAHSGLLCTYIGKFFTLPWFSRTWTVQEYFLARNLVFQCGQHTEPDELFINVMDSIDYHFGNCCDKKVALWALDDLERSPLRGLATHRALWDCNRGPSTVSSFLALLISIRSRKSFDPRDKVFGILSLADSTFQASLVPNYKMSVGEVYESVVTTSITLDQSLDVFSCVTGDMVGRADVSSFVPDWADELTWDVAMIYLLRWGTLSGGYFDTCRGTPAQITFTENSPAVCRITVVDTIQKTQVSDDGRTAGSTSTFEDTNDFVEENADFSNIAPIDEPKDDEDTLIGVSNSNVTGCTDTESEHDNTSSASSNDNEISRDSLLDRYYDIADIHSPCSVYPSKPAAFWRVMCGNLFKDDAGMNMDTFEVAKTSDFSKFMKWQMRHRTGRHDLYDDDGFDLAKAIVSLHRRFFVTEEGYMGWAPPEARTGDVVVVMPGGKVPYVLRRLNDDDDDDDVDSMGDSSDGNAKMDGNANVDGASKATASDASQTAFSLPRYRFLGDAYVQGIMNGEAFDESKLGSILLV